MIDRITGCVLLTVAALYGLTAGQFVAGLGDPLGPSAFPRILAVLLAGMSLYLVFRPDSDPEAVRRGPFIKQIVTVAVLIAYGALLQRVGFAIATISAVTVLALLVGAQRLYALLVGVGITATLFVLFDTILGLPLPLLPAF